MVPISHTISHTASDVSLAHITAAGIRGTATNYRLTLALSCSEGQQRMQCDRIVDM